MSDKPFPDQPIVRDDDGHVCFKRNLIVRYLLDMGRQAASPTLSLDALHNVPGFTTADWEQFMQLVGYRVSSFQELSFVTDETNDRIDALLDERWSNANKES